MKSHLLALGMTAAFITSLAFAAHPKLSVSSAATIPPFNTEVIMNSAKPSVHSTVATLDVLGLGLSVEMFRQSQTWFEMQKKRGRSILPSDLSTFPTNYTVKELASDKRSADVVEWGASKFVEDWPIPSVTVWAHCYHAEEPQTEFGGRTNYDYFNDRVDDLRMPAGMHHHRIASLGAIFLNEPDDVLERAFQFFDQNPEVPVLLVYASDGDMIRRFTGDVPGRRYWEEGPRRPDSMTESMVVLLLARRDRVDALRPFVPHIQGNQNAQYFAERDRQLNAARVAARAAGKPEPHQLVFKPSRFLPVPWTEEQIAQFDSLPTIAVLHRPVRVSYRKDKHGRPTFDPAQTSGLMHDQEQQAAFKTGLDLALHDIPGGKPARIFYDTAGPSTGRHVVPLTVAAHTSLPGFDLFKPDQGYDIWARLGNTGAASPFVQWALAAIATYHQKDASMTVNLRQREEATITVVTPSTDTTKRYNSPPLDFKLAP